MDVSNIIDNYKQHKPESEFINGDVNRILYCSHQLQLYKLRNYLLKIVHLPTYLCK